ncbi:MAG: hypothetical protein GX321_08690 [Clostridiales bacterium]|nr:hypothetical protein [Clostridiales bacterium]
MKINLKQKIARATAGNKKLNKKIMQIKRSWDEVEGIINGTPKKRKK